MYGNFRGSTNRFMDYEGFGKTGRMATSCPDWLFCRFMEKDLMIGRIRWTKLKRD